MSAITPQEAADWIEEHCAALIGPYVRVLIDHARAVAPEGGDLADAAAVRAEVRRRMYAVAASWRVSPPTPADARISRDQAERHETWRQVAEDVEAWADAADHLVPDLVPAPSVAAPPREDETDSVDVVDDFALALPFYYDVARKVAEEVGDPDDPPNAWEIEQQVETTKRVMDAIVALGPRPGTVRDPERAT